MLAQHPRRHRLARQLQEARVDLVVLAGFMRVLSAAFLERWLFDEGAWTTVPERVLRRHLGVCVDLCHLAVVGDYTSLESGSLRDFIFECNKGSYVMFPASVAEALQKFADRIGAIR